MGKCINCGKSTGFFSRATLCKTCKTYYTALAISSLEAFQRLSGDVNKGFKNIDSYLSRFQIILQKFKEMEKANTMVPGVVKINATYNQLFNSLCAILRNAFNNRLESIDKLKTDKGKINNYTKELNGIYEYKVTYPDFLDILNEFEKEINSLAQNRGYTLNSTIDDKPEVLCVDKKSANAVLLKWLDRNKTIPTDNERFPVYFYYQYNIQNPLDRIKELIEQGYITICNTTFEDKLSSLTVAQLKEILKNKNLKTSGNKASLVNAVLNNFEEKEIKLPTLKQKISLTEKGSSLAAKGDIDRKETINQAFKFILDGNYLKAYQHIARYEAKKPGSRGMGLDWKEEMCKKKYPDDKACKFLMDYDLKEISDPNKQVKIKCLAILTHMLGSLKKDELTDYIDVNESIEIVTKQKCEHSESEVNIRSYISYLSSIISLQRDLINFKEDKIKSYQVLSCDSSCNFCKNISSKSILVKDAIIGENCPPFGTGCRCCIISNDY